MIKLEPLTNDLYERLEGKRPEVSLRGVAAVDGDEVLGIVCVTCWPDDNYICAVVTDRLKKHKKVIIHGFRQFAAMLDRTKTYYCPRDMDLETSHMFLTHFGFEPLEDDLYIYRGT